MAALPLDKKHLHTSFGDVAYLESGSQDKPPVLLVHGIPTSSFLWRHVLQCLGGDFHCYAPDLMGLGDTRVEPQTSSLDMDAQAEMLLEFMSTLGHQRFSVICHDQGSAAVQILATRQPQRVNCLVLTNCVCYDNWPVPLIAFYQRLFRIPLLLEVLTKARVLEWQETRTPLSAFRRGVYRRERMSNEAIREYLRPYNDAAQLQSFKRFILAGDPRYTQQVVDDLKRFQKPTLVVWAADDRFIPPSWGRKLFDDIPGAERFELIPQCGHFWQEERPAEFVAVLRPFRRSTPGATWRGKSCAAKRHSESGGRCSGMFDINMCWQRYYVHRSGNVA
jgi:pimeloyl-ACP methyl ester carboxylesterase